MITEPIEGESTPLVAYCRRVAGRASIVIEVPTPVLDQMHLRARRCWTAKTKRVRVIAVDKATAKGHYPPFGLAQPVKVGHVFSSASVASAHLGYASNAVARSMGTSRWLAKRAGKEFNGRVTLRGVTLTYEQEAKAL
jgi:hypothetical protein